MKSYALLLTTLFLSSAAAAQEADSATAKAGYNLFHPTPKSQLRELRPDRPGVTESAFTVDPGHFQLESDVFRLVNSADEGHHERAFFVNHALLKVGLTTRTDFQVEISSYDWQKQWEDDEAAAEKHYGFGDVTLRLKRNLIGEDGHKLSLGLLGYTRLPTGRGVGSGAVEAGLIVPMNYEATDKLNIDAQLEGDFDYDRQDTEHYLQLAPSAALDYEFTKLFTGFVEVVGLWDTRQAAWKASVNLGPQLQLSENVILDFGTHLALTKDTDHEYFLGISFRR